MSAGRTPNAIAAPRRKRAAELISAGWAPKAIAAEIGLTTSRVVRIVNECGFRPVYLNQQERAFIDAQRVTGGAGQ